jgi:dihydrofolate reductase
MRKLILRMLLTLDEVAAGEHGQIDNVNYGDEGSWRDIFNTLKTVDAMLVGAAAHKEYLDYWHAVPSNPKADANERRFAEIAARTPHYVLSRTLRSVDYPNASVLPGGVEGIADLKRQTGGDIVLWGGPTVAAAAIEAGQVDEYHFDIHPVIAGRGKKLFANVSRAQRLRHLSTDTHSSGVLTVKHANA